MDPEVKPDPTSPEFVADELSVDITADDSGTLTPVPVTRTDNEQWREIGEKASLFLAELPDYLSSFFGEYKRPIVVVGLVLGSIIAVKLTLAVLDSVNDIPLLAPTFELIGLFYSGWFVYRYLLRASNRKELADDFNALKEQILGNRASND
jgi:hypothetical protein